MNLWGERRHYEGIEYSTRPDGSPKELPMGHDEEIKIDADVPIDDIDDNTQDLTVYDLAERLAAGRILTVGGNHEVEDELHRINLGLKALVAGLDINPTTTPKEMAVELLRLRVAIHKLDEP